MWRLSDEEPTMIRTKGIEERLDRLDQLVRGLSNEVALWRSKGSPLLDAERRLYLNGIQDVIAGLDVARVSLAKALQRAKSEKGAA
jgi:hypothetical protein